MINERSVLPIKPFHKGKSQSSPIGRKDHEFRCPDCEDDRFSQDNFCSPFSCPEAFPQPRFSSPNSSFEPSKLEEINEWIEQANEILLALGTEEDSNNLRLLQVKLRRLRGQFFAVHITCGKETAIFKGPLIDAGIDFLIIKSKVGNNIMIPFERITFIKRVEQETGNDQDQELIGIEPCLRRSITFHFGEVVSKSPFLVNLFFGLKLELLLESYVNDFVYVKKEGIKNEVDGVLQKVKHRGIELLVDQEKHGIDFDEICYIEIEEQALTRTFLCSNKRPIIN